MRQCYRVFDLVTSIVASLSARCVRGTNVTGLPVADSQRRSPVVSITVGRPQSDCNPYARRCLAVLFPYKTNSVWQPTFGAFPEHVLQNDAKRVVNQPWKANGMKLGCYCHEDHFGGCSYSRFHSNRHTAAGVETNTGMTFSH